VLVFGRVKQEFQLGPVYLEAIDLLMQQGEAADEFAWVGLLPAVRSRQ
jgi:hypothetical protein